MLFTSWFLYFLFLFFIFSFCPFFFPITLLSTIHSRAKAPYLLQPFQTIGSIESPLWLLHQFSPLRWYTNIENNYDDKTIATAQPRRWLHGKSREAGFAPSFTCNTSSHKPLSHQITQHMEKHEQKHPIKKQVKFKCVAHKDKLWEMKESIQMRVFEVV